MASDDHYCRHCGRTQALGCGFITCRYCGSLGLREYERRPRRVICPRGCGWSGWDDGGVNDDLGRHLRRDHEEARRGR